MKWDFLSDKDKTKEILLNLRILSYADEKLTAEELQFLRDVGVSHGLSQEETDIILASQDSPSTQPESEQDRMSLLYYMVFMIKVDQEIDDKEEQLIYHFGLKLGFRESLIREFILLAKKYIRQGIPPQEMLNKIKTYMN